MRTQIFVAHEKIKLIRPEEVPVAKKNCCLRIKNELFKICEWYRKIVHFSQPTGSLMTFRLFLVKYVYIVIWLYVLTVSTYTVKTIRVAPYIIACSMQHVSPVYPGSCKTCFFHIPVFGRKVFLIFQIIYLRSNLHIGLSDLVNPLIFADSCPGWHNYSLWGLLF